MRSFLASLLLSLLQPARMLDEQALLRELSYGSPPERWLAAPLPGEALEEPIERWVRLYQGRGRPLMRLALLRLREDRAILEPILEEYGLTDLYLAVPVAESSLARSVVSRLGAVGPWQLMPQTAQELGLSTAPGRDERQDLARSTVAAARYLARIRSRLKSDDLTLAAYNAGPTAVLSALRASEGGGWARVAPMLSDEARQYVPKVRAVALILDDPRRFGFDP